MKFIRTTKSKNGVEHEGYRYGLVKGTENVYRCTVKTCGARLYVCKNEQRLDKEHNHTNNKKVNYESREKLITYAKTPLPPFQIISKIFDDLDVSEKKFIPKKKFLKELIRKERMNKHDDVDLHENIPNIFRETTEGETFLQYKNEDNSILVFYNEKFINLLKDTQYAIGDGTFKSVSKEFKQLYTFHLEVKNEIFPMIYIFLKTKSEKIYVELFEFLISKDIFTEKKRFIVDFEYAAVSAIKKIYKGAFIEFCLYHFCQTIYSKIKKLGFCRLYKNNAMFRKNIKCIMYLPFLKPEDMLLTLDIIKKKILKFEPGENINVFFNYLHRVYFGSFEKEALFKRQDLSLYGRCQRGEPLTTNNSEGWHKGLNWNIKECNPKFGKIMNFILASNNCIENDILEHLCKCDNDIKNYASKNKKGVDLIALTRYYDKYDKYLYLELVLKIYGLDFEND